MKDNRKPARVSRWLIWAGILFLLCQIFLPGRLLGQKLPLRLTKQSDTNNDVFFCHRLVDDWRLQLLLPGVEHYSIWLPKKKLHRGLTSNGVGYPLQWVNEVYLDQYESEAERSNKGLSCEAISNVNSICIERELMRQQEEGRWSLTNHCQHKIVEILVKCSEKLR